MRAGIGLCDADKAPALGKGALASVQRAVTGFRNRGVTGDSGNVAE